MLRSNSIALTEISVLADKTVTITAICMFLTCSVDALHINIYACFCFCKNRCNSCNFVQINIL